ncbi:fluoride efflux transporter CrcB [Pseudomonas sp. nanlin1]|uniref:fluoride efflux transporter CrcB n=1 Tax=Pseudomonas sp. nanlin1 TaxID=3040605 RepID=UPI00388FBE49
MIPTLLMVTLGGIVGTWLRFATATWVNANWPRHFYTGTLAVNIVGCLIIGYLYGLFMLRPDIPVEVRSGLMVGFVGGLTTFSSFSLDTVRLLESGQALIAISYCAVSVFGGLLATWAGLALTKI